MLFKSHSVLIESFEEGQVVTQLVAPFSKFCKQLKLAEEGGSSPQSSASKLEGWLGGMWRSVMCCFGQGRGEEEDVQVDLSLGHFVVTQVTAPGSESRGSGG